MKKRLVSGIKPTGDLTLGNYIGALKNFVKMQQEYDSYLFVADLHALTTGSVDPKELKKARYEIVAMYLACGLDPEKTTIFFQSDLTEHSEAQWLMTSEVSLGELNRMTQFKDKAQKVTKQENGTEKIPAGLLMYPVLMAADILIYNADVVPVGEDQKQHLELTKTIANRLNKNYKTNFKIPQGIVPPVGARIKSLTNPEVKMSKSEKSAKSTIYLHDDPEAAYKKILKAVTDSENKVYISENKPGILNLLHIYAALTNQTLEQVEAKFKNSNYGEFKHEVGLVVKNELTKIQTKYNEIQPLVAKVVEQGKIKAQAICKPIVQELKQKMGFN
ncbi:tryptophan--tRNA ligase [Mycoplasmopsis gallopavonis]|uniref:Tryptophan--tRNA ligase n=1 Tax=Mycoplasmopsis gallopavonis TaxID=76629 RepID=A0A449B010_9BACT|nr:tryptophan--tRNA ligase [Mycoplasmopsis gallopavonis]RIV16472.1 tryptophan--tRNA ligase [Mycoplasmopsis gallopavonis]VEU73091.1 tryptophanyl-tRNA synthetase [Mycoplasmopsis gallopavonis]